MSVALLVAAALVQWLRPDLRDALTGSWQWIERTAVIAGIAGTVVAVAAMTIGSKTAKQRIVVQLEHKEIRQRNGEVAGTLSVEAPVGRLTLPVRGRNDLVRRISRAILRRRGGSPVLVLSGLGGSGKTTVALAVAADMAKRRGAVWWVSAATATDLHAGMREVTRRLGVMEDEIDRAWSGLGSATDLLWRQLRLSRRRWLLVIDNADDPRLLAGEHSQLAEGTGWLRPPPSSSGTVLVTSRVGQQQEWGNWCQLYPLEVLSKHDGAQILLDHVGQRAGTHSDAEALAARLGGLPLALRLAGSYLAETSANPWRPAVRTFNDYRAMLDADKGAELLDIAGTAPRSLEAPSRQTISRTWELSLDLLSQRGMPVVRHLLRLLAHFADRPIPYELLLHPQTLSADATFVDMDAVRLWQALNALADLSMIDLIDRSAAEGTTSDPALLRMHPLVRQVSQLHAERSGATPTYLGTAASLCRRIAVEEDPTSSSEDPRRWSTWEALAPHMLALLDEVRRHPDLEVETVDNALALVARVVNYLRYRGLQDEAESTNQKALSVGRPKLGEENFNVLVLRHSMAAFLHARGEFQEAEAEYQNVLNVRCRILGEHHLETLATRSQLALLAVDRGDYEGAAREAGDLLSVHRRLYGALHRRTLIVWSVFGRALRLCGNLAGSEHELTELVTAEERVRGIEHPRSLSTRRSLAETLHERGQIDRAERLYMDVLAIQSRVLGEHHSNVLKTRRLLAKLRRDQGRLNAAERECKAVLSEQTRLLGEGDRETVTTRALLAQIFRDRGHSEAALREFRAVLDVRQHILGTDHQDTRSVQATVDSLVRDRNTA